MNAYILARHAGIGNQVQFTPVIDRLLHYGYQVSSDSDLYGKLGLPVDVTTTRTDFDRVYIVFGAPWWLVWLTRIRFCNSKIYGYRYRIRGRLFSLGIDEAHNFHHNMHEVWQNVFAFGGEVKYQPRPAKSETVVLHYVTRPDRAISKHSLYKLRYKHAPLDYKVRFVGDPLDDPRYIATPTLEDLIAVLKDAAWFIGPDTGVMHIADYFGCKCVVYFGPTSARKSGAVNGINIQSDMACSPCYEWGRVKCDEFKCLTNTAGEGGQQ